MKHGWKSTSFYFFNQPNGKQVLKNYYQVLQHTSFGKKKKKIANKQRCKENGVVHWECHYPYGNGELHETSNMCSIDLDTLAEEG